MKILNKKMLVDTEGSRIVEMGILAPEIAQKALPGQFVVLMVSAEGERIPLTVVDRNIDKGSITLILQEAGLTTKLLGAMRTGDFLYAIVGPLGHPTEIKDYGNLILVGGGVGIAEIYPVAKALKKCGNRITTILGSRTKELLILENELKAVSDNLLIATDDGSYGKKGFVTDILSDLITNEPANQRTSEPANYQLVYAVGPIPMMKAVAKLTKEFNVKTIVSLNALMVDATGMCGCCRVTVGGRTMFSCVDGPEFDAAAVDWEELTKRNRIYEDKEKHICKLKGYA